MKAGNANQRQRLQDALAAQQGAGRLRSCPLTPAAPDLLAAAETCSEFFNDNGDFTEGGEFIDWESVDDVRPFEIPFPDEVPQFVQDLRAAIAKAKGVTP